jgi:hypothetical protein
MRPALYASILDIYSFWGRIAAHRGAVAQLGERYNRTVEVRGSNPLSSITLHGPVAQLGARLNGIEEAEGSSPSGST